MKKRITEKVLCYLQIKEKCTNNKHQVLGRQLLKKVHQKSFIKNRILRVCEKKNYLEDNQTFRNGEKRLLTKHEIQSPRIFMTLN